MSSNILATNLFTIRLGVRVRVKLSMSWLKACPMKGGDSLRSLNVPYIINKLLYVRGNDAQVCGSSACLTALSSASLNFSSRVDSPTLESNAETYVLRP